MGGGDWCLVWGPQSDQDSIATIRRAVDRGLNWIDTSNVYGLGRSEHVIGRALRGMPRAARPYVFGKCGYSWDELGNVVYSLEAAAIRRALDDSLRRLGLDAFDLYQVDAAHGPYAGAPHAGSIEEAWSTLRDLTREGKVRAIGLSGFGVGDIVRAEAIAPVASLQVRYSLVRRTIERDLLPFCAARGIDLIAAGPMESGLLTGALTSARVDALPHNDWRRGGSGFQTAVLARALEAVDRLRAIGAARRAAPGAVAIAWALRDSAVAGAVAGARRPEQIESIAAAASLALTGDEIAVLEDEAPGARSEHLEDEASAPPARRI
jgi:aryl-alcohol dehydrogenase-like predicted oxidoreductase